MKKITLFAILIALAFAASAEKMWISVSSAPVKASTGFFAKTVATLQYAAQVEQTKTQGKWSFVSWSGGSGWIATSSLSKRKIVAAGKNFSADADELALAGKGFNAEVESDYKKSGKANYDAVDEMERVSISESELLQFITEGKLKGVEE